MAKVYVAMAADFIHPGHIKIIKEAQNFGDVIVGLLTDKAIATYKRVPVLKYEERKVIIENIKGVQEVVEQDSADYTENLRKIRPRYVVHGDDWTKDARIVLRKKVIETLKEWGGELVEPPFTPGYSSNDLLKHYLEEVHNGLSARIVEKTNINDGLELKEFDAMWVSSLTDSVAKGKPDTQCVDFTSRVQTIDQIFDVTTKPLIVDGDNGGSIDQFRFMVRTLERLGVSAIIIEDKIGPKRNSLLGKEVAQTQDTIEAFCNKISEGKKSQITEEFMIIARIESLILKAGLEDTLKRASAYIGAGADGIMIHSKEREPTEILSFCQEYKAFEKRVPLVVVPSTYDSITENELKHAGVDIVIYANQLLRSAFPAMVKAAESILRNQRAKESQEFCMSIEEIITLIPEH
jgi:phosphoenolpyruvate phosphomutase / 2-hydroxyethylphosphonate cytidylyltransferase